MSEVFTEKDLEKLIKEVEENGYAVEPMDAPPTYNLYKKYEQNVAEGKLRRPPNMINDYDRFYKIFDHTEEQIEKALETIGQYAYVFPQNPNEPVEVKINVLEMSDFDIEEFERKFLEELKNVCKKSD